MLFGRALGRRTTFDWQFFNQEYKKGIIDFIKQNILFSVHYGLREYPSSGALKLELLEIQIM
jgi:hypothetical protein